MSWITVIWSMTAAACLTLSGIHFLVWWQRRTAWADLVFTLTAVGVAVFAGYELAMMRAQTPEQFATALRWLQVPTWVIVVSLAAFVRLHLRAGRRWLAWSIVALRSSALLLNFVTGQNLNYRHVTDLRRISFLGETASLGEGLANPWMLVGQLSLVLLVVFTVDAMITVWRRGDRRQAVLTGGSIAFFALMGMTQAILVLWRLADMPMTASFFFLGIVVAMGFEMSRGTLRAAQLSDELLESQQRMRLAADAADLSLWEWDVVRDEVWMTEKGHERAGLDASDRISFDRFLQTIHPDDREPTRRAVQRSLESDGNFEADYRVTNPDGVMRWLVARGQVERDGNGKPQRLRGISVDVTERKQGEERFRMVVEASSSAMIMADARGIMLLANARAELVFGYPREELIGRSIDILLPAGVREVHADHRREYLVDSQTRTMGAGRELFGLRKDGSEVPVEIGLSTIRTPEGPLVLASIVDITERRRAQQEAAQQRNELAHLSRVTMLGELSGSLAHELNQPLTAILSNAQAAQRFMAQDSVDLDELRGILKDIVDEDKRAGEVIRRLRLLFKKGEVQYQELDLADAIEDAVKLLHSDLVNQDVTVRHELRPGLPLVRGDRVQLQQVIINLIMNGCDAMAGTRSPGRQILVRAEPTDEHGVRVTVDDRGCGIPAGGLETVFEPFYTTKARGMGLGLAVCRTIITTHGGRLWAENNADGGASFRFTVPVWSGETQHEQAGTDGVHRR